MKITILASAFLACLSSAAFAATITCDQSSGTVKAVYDTEAKTLAVSGVAGMSNATFQVLSAEPISPEASMVIARKGGTYASLTLNKEGPALLQALAISAYLDCQGE